MASAMIDEPPSPAKLLLIRRFLIANGSQAKIDSGQFLERFAMPGGPLFAIAAGTSSEVTFQMAFQNPLDALKRAYAPHRATWQAQYERHVNWEFGEEELSAIVDFLESPAGVHYLEGRWRMDAYISTNTEELVEEIIEEASAVLQGHAGSTKD